MLVTPDSLNHGPRSLTSHYCELPDVLNRVPIFSRIAGDGIEYPKCCFMNDPAESTAGDFAWWPFTAAGPAAQEFCRGRHPSGRCCLPFQATGVRLPQR